MIDLRATPLHLLLRRLSLRSHLNDDETRTVLALPADVTPIRAHADFVQGGARMDYSCLIVDGLVARFEQLEDGRRQIFGLHIPGDLVDLSSFLLGRAPAGLHAICRVSVVRIPHSALRAAIARFPALGEALWRDSVADATITAQGLVRLGRRDAYGRMAHLLCEMAVRYGHIGALEKTSYRFPITQEQLSDTLGLTSVHVNRTLRSLREDRLVVFASNRVDILDWPALRAAAAFDPEYLCAPKEMFPAALAA